MASQPPTYDNSIQHNDVLTPQPAEPTAITPSANEKAAMAGYYTTQEQQQPTTTNPTQSPPPQPQPQTTYTEAQAKQGSPAQQRRNVYQNAVPLSSLEKYPAVVDCPVCGQREMTATTKQSGGTTHGTAALCCICLCLGCIPYLFSEFKDTMHKCGSCAANLALWHRSGSTEVLVRNQGVRV